MFCGIFVVRQGTVKDLDGKVQHNIEYMVQKHPHICFLTERRPELLQKRRITTLMNFGGMFLEIW